MKERLAGIFLSYTRHSSHLHYFFSRHLIHKSISYTNPSHTQIHLIYNPSYIPIHLTHKPNMSAPPPLYIIYYLYKYIIYSIYIYMSVFYSNIYI